MPIDTTFLYDLDSIEEGFVEQRGLLSKNLHRFSSTVSELEFCKDVLSVLHVFGGSIRMLHCM